MLERPTFSIIMPSFQQSQFLEEAVRSVLEQKEVSVVLLVMDPGSTDGSRDILQKLKTEFSTSLQLHMEPDNGQSDAINKGMNRSRGDIMAWLNSDDRLRPGALKAVASLLHNKEPIWLYGKAGIIDAKGNPVTSYISNYKNWRGRKFSHNKLLTENFIPQMATFWNRKMWENSGGLVVEKHLDMDYDLWLRFAEISNPVAINKELADFRVHAEAKGSRETDAQLAAAFKTATEHAKANDFKTRIALVIHRILGWRTRLIYSWLKPK